MFDAYAAEGDITSVKTQSEGNNLEYDTDNGLHNSLVQVDSDTYALAYRGTDDDGFMSTFTISDDGETITKVSTLEFAPNHNTHNSLVQVDSDTYALAFGGNDDAGWINTFTISADGETITKVKQLKHDTNKGLHNSLVQVDSDTYALAYRGNDNDGFMSTFTISADGSTITEISTLEFAPNHNTHNSLVQVDSDTYALAFGGNDDAGWINTFTISADGETITKVKQLKHDTNKGLHNSLVQVDSDTYALAYRGNDDDGFMSTFTISANGSTITEVDSLEHDTDNAKSNSLVQVDSDTYALAYQGTDDDGFMSTFTIDSDGNITAVKTQSEGNNMEHDTDSSFHNSLIQVDSDTYALAYRGTGDDGFISTFTISAADTTSTTSSSTTSSSTTSSSGGGCGFDRDCTAPRITNHGESETPDGFSINDNIFEENQERYNKNPTIQGTVGEPVTIKVRAWENMGTDKITLAIAYLAMHDEKPDWKDSTANIEFSIQQDEFKVYDKNKIFSAVGAVTEKVEDPYGDNGALELLDITFTIIFAKPMEASHIGIQTMDYITNYDLVYFENALEILPREIVQVEEMPEETPEKVPESLPEVVPEEIPESEPPVKEPEPEVMLTTIDEKTVLEFVDENMPAKHYVKRYITETEYKKWFDVNYPEYQFWEGIGITQERFDQIILEIQSEPKPKMIQTGFVLVPDDQKSLPLVEETYEPEPIELEPVKEEKKGFFDWLFDLFN